MKVVDLAAEWTAAIGAGDAEGLLRLVAPDILIAGPRGSVRGAEALRGWLERAGARFTTLRVFAREGVAVLEQDGTWVSAETVGQPSRARLASVLWEEGGRIVAFARHDRLEAALEAAGLTQGDAVA